ncbi:tyrosine-type recombinase/integrase [Chitinophagaceae bacterium LB-8]|uniref:Tyrosine recombinase XerC n=1 Tax=Paraflavisolibacter caeni TaxID=2982496 RepID=A0A9X2XWW4_9BACT|nr:tyrosine-type recombinase/integrase [Paraflavisolibacter caeni]MCU7550022.1 tyrosine-type recombinase/integrase [Paraflavisolibacter caeni]
MSSTEQIIQPFLDFLKFEKRYSQHTILSYQTDLISFFDYLVTSLGGVEQSQISHIYIRSWLASIKDEGMTAKTINRKISTLRSFFKYQMKVGVLTQTPMNKIIAPKSEKRLPNFVSESEIDTLFRHVDFGDDWKGRTDRLLLLIFYQTGLRVTELVTLKEGHVNKANSTIKVLGKGGKERVIPVAPELMNEILTYISFKKEASFNSLNECLLVNEKGGELNRRGVYAIVKKYLSMVTTIEKRSPHVLRHTFATHLTNNGADINAVKELLGHSSLAATQVYTHNSIEKLKSVYNKAHPKA